MMNKEQFIQFIKTPETLNTESAALLENLVKEYPYCQTADILYTLNLYKERSFRFNDQLKYAAAYAPDRKLFKQHLNSLEPLKEVSKQFQIQKKTEPDVDVLEDVAEKHSDIRALVAELKNAILDKLSNHEDPAISRQLNSLDHIVEHLDKKPEQKTTDKDIFKPDIKDYDFDHLQKLPSQDSNIEKNKHLIDKFLEEEPSISAPVKTDFFSPEELAKKSLEDNDEVVSETLAKLFLKQGNLAKAVKIYKKLSLLYPEKNTFFAAQIEKINEGQK
ncbi:MAG: hypothetical protein R2750_04055 [Bacteroidales bacterium]